KWYARVLIVGRRELDGRPARHRRQPNGRGHGDVDDERHQADVQILDGLRRPGNERSDGRTGERDRGHGKLAGHDAGKCRPRADERASSETEHERREELRDEVVPMSSNATIAEPPRSVSTTAASAITATSPRASIATCRSGAAGTSTR